MRRVENHIKFMKKPFSVLIFLAIGFILSCTKNEYHFISNEKKITSFVLESSLNPILKESVEAQISRNFIHLDIPHFAMGMDFVASFEHNGVAVFIDTLKQQSKLTSNKFHLPLRYAVTAEDGSKNTYNISVNWADTTETLLPRIYINLFDDKQIEDITKTDYINGSIVIRSKNSEDNFAGEMEIRGRGNNSWGLPKKPFRIKLTEKASLFGLPAYRDWILLAEYLDGSMLYNSIPFKTGHLLDIPYTNHIIPVELYVNGELQGVYAFTEHKEVGEGRIDIGNNGWLIELDETLDEDWQFESSAYGLPVMIQHPKSKNMTETLFDEMKADFEQLEALVFDDSFPNNDFLNYFDDTAFINYMIVYQLTLNQEINIPRSTYINKPVGEKYQMGIIWDFDWAFGYSQSFTHYDLATAETPLFWGVKPGSEFFEKIFNSPHMKALFKDKWEWFIHHQYDELKEHMSLYAEIIGPSLERDHEIWGERGSSGNSKEDLQKVFDWLDTRVAYVSSKL